MSSVTDVILTSGLNEGRAREAINAWLAGVNYTPLLEVSGLWRAGKAMQAEAAIGAYYYLDWEAFVAVVMAAPWCAPDRVRLFVQFENSEHGFSEQDTDRR